MGYAIGECDGCGLEITKDHLTKFTVTRDVGTYINGRSKTVVREVYRCDGCIKILEDEAAAEAAAHQAYLAATKRAAVRRNLTFLAMLAIVIGVIWWAIAHAPPTATETQAPGPAASPQEASAPIKPAPTQVVGVANPPPISPSPPQAPLSPALAVTDDSNIGIGLGDYSPAILYAVRGALETGQPRPWRDGADFGWVTVSTPGGPRGDCRSIQVVHGSLQDRPVKVCRGDDGTWPVP